MSWLNAPIVLEGKKVKLEPLSSEHFEPLVKISRYEHIWDYLPVEGINSDLLLQELKSSLMKRASEEQYPFIIRDVATHNIIGSTRFINLVAEHRNLEIGWTWYNPAYWGTGHNIECKYLLLAHCFESLNCIRVELRATEKNERSRAAILKIGAKFDGILRNHRIRRDGSIRNTAVYSIINEEWPDVKKMLEEKMNG